jgi:phenylacetate-CoA ligase
MSRYRFLPDLSDDAFAAVQLSGLQWTVEHALRNSPFYRGVLTAAGVQSGDIRSLDDLRRLPFTTVADLREGYPLPLLSVPEKDVVRIHASSGTTGKRKILAYTATDVENFKLMMARCYELAGLSVEDRVQIAVGYGLWTAGAGFQLGCEHFGAMAVPVGPGNLEMQLQLLTDVGVTCLCSTASMALLMSEEVERHGLLDRVRLKKVIFGAEAHSPKMRKAFEERLGLEDSFDIAGMTEMYGPGTGLECRAHDGIHYWADMFIIEVLDPVTLEPVAPGEVGEMVVTSLRKEAAPLIRYRTRDLTRMLPGRCSCGLECPRHDHILGRSDDMIIFRGVNIYPGQIADVLQQHAELGAEYQLTLTRRDGRDAMQLRVERAQDAPGLGSEGEAALVRSVADELHRKLMARCGVELAAHGELPRSFAKSKRVVDLREQE